MLIVMLTAVLVEAEFTVKYHLSASDSSSLSVEELIRMAAETSEDPST
jgi:hypothetical protein